MLGKQGANRVLSRIYHLGEKSQVGEGHELPGGGGGGGSGNFNLCALTSSRLGDFSDIVTNDNIFF